MSRELDALRRLARTEQAQALVCLRRLPARCGDAMSALAREHPLLSAGGASMIALLVIGRRRRRKGTSGSKSIPAALAALGTQALPGLLRFAGLTLATTAVGSKSKESPAAQSADGPQVAPGEQA